MKDERWQEWTDDQRKDEALAKRAGYASVDAWVDALNDVTEELRDANDSYDRFWEIAKRYGVVK